MITLNAVLSASTVTTTFLQFMSGALVCRKFVQNKSTGDSSAFPFICGFLSCSLWLKYGTLANEMTVVLVNAVGATLFFSYFIVFWMFTVNTGAIYRQFFGAILVLGLVLSYTNYYQENRNEAIEVVGYVCCTITVLFFAAPCCMLVDVFRTRSTEMLPIPLILMSFIGSVQWLAFGIIANDIFLQIPNLLGALLSGTQLSLVCIYPNKPRISSTSTSSTDIPYAIF
ncbi:sugar transporter SWEET1 isoform X2 [Contarinia nasturtii]|nr:sugar transporter SWEET1 isoform X2 [Contarinia nasturtii]XP_031623751.1 sugar transporter SWEET1 isoform X2 [Contarinia nasturtii]